MDTLERKTDEAVIELANLTRRLADARVYAQGHPGIDAERFVLTLGQAKDEAVDRFLAAYGEQIRAAQKLLESPPLPAPPRLRVMPPFYVENEEALDATEGRKLSQLAQLNNGLAGRKP